MTTIKKPMSETEKSLFKEAVIKEYQLKHPKEVRKKFAENLLKELRFLRPFNIIIGLAAAIFLVYLEGFTSLVHLLLFGIIWLTLISTLLPIFLKQQ